MDLTVGRSGLGGMLSCARAIRFRAILMRPSEEVGDVVHARHGRRRCRAMPAMSSR